MNVKWVLNHVSRNGLMQKMEAPGVDRDLVRWTTSLMSERTVSLVVEGHQCEIVEVETTVRQESSDSYILFAVYLSGIFKEVEEEIEWWMAISFADDLV